MKTLSSKLLRFSSLLLALCLLLPAAGVAQTKEEEGAGPRETFWDRSKEGWFWYKDPPPEEEEEEVAEKEPAPSPPKTFRDFTEEEVWKMPPPQFQEVYDNTLNLAVQTPSVENVTDWYRMQDIGRRKALEFTHVSQYVVQTNPQMNFMKDSPLAAPGRKVLYRQRKENVQEVIARARDKNGLIYFYSPTCPYCVEQTKILRRFSGEYGWEIRPVNIEQEPNLAEHFQVETVPTVLLVDQDNPTPFPVGVGVVATSELEENIFRGMRILEGSRDPSQFHVYDFQEGTALDPMATRPGSSPVPGERRQR